MMGLVRSHRRHPGRRPGDPPDYKGLLLSAIQDPDPVLFIENSRAIVVHEAVRHFGPGGEIAATIQEELFRTLKAPVCRQGAPYCAVPFAKVLEDAFLVQPADIAVAARALCEYT